MRRSGVISSEKSTRAQVTQEKRMWSFMLPLVITLTSYHLCQAPVMQSGTKAGHAHIPFRAYQTCHQWLLLPLLPLPCFSRNAIAHREDSFRSSLVKTRGRLETSRKGSAERVLSHPTWRKGRQACVTALVRERRPAGGGQRIVR
jgi:hypothetical protein